MDLATLDPAQKRALLAERLRQAAETNGPRQAPLSFAQQRLWFIDQMQPGRPIYTIAAALRLRGALDVARLAGALDQIRARHGSLRTRFAEQDGTPVQVIEAATAPALIRRDVAAAALDAALADFARQPFDLATGPLLRCMLLRIGPEDHVLAMAAHHIIADYRSLQVMIREFVTLYQDAGATLPPLPIQYADHALRQRQRDGALHGQVAYWREALAGLPAVLEIATDFPRPARQGYRGARHPLALSAMLSARVETLAQARGMTPFMLLLAGFQILLHRYSGSRDICTGTTVSNRDRTELQDLVGYFVNTLALRSTIGPDDSFDSLLARLRATVLDAMAHQEAPFEQVVESLGVPRSLSHSPVFQSMFTLHEKQPDRISLPGLEITPMPLAGQAARFDLSLDMFRGERFTGVLEYDTDLFTADTAARMAAHFTRLLEAVCAAPAQPLSAIDLLGAEEHAVIARANATARPVPEADLATLIEAQVAARGEAEALVFGETRLSYRALNTAANRLTHHLSGRIGRGDRLAVCLPRGVDMVVTLLAALKLGAVYVPLDPSHPAERRNMILTDAAVALMVVSGDVQAGCPVLDLDSARGTIAAEPAHDPARQVAGDDLAYVIFTSGTTGRPKGVPIRQDSLVNLLVSMAGTPGMTGADTLVAVTTPAFDIAGLEIFLPLLTGGRVVVADADAVLDDLALSRLIADSGATMMQATPSTWRLLADGGWQAPAGFRMLCGGEALDAPLAARLLQGGGRLFNLYGPTETTIWSACAEVTATDCAAGRIPLGGPVANTTLHVLDEALQPCPPGVAGELFIGGIGLSPGYLDRPDLTAERFVTVVERLYRTGDRVLRQADGALHYLGRLDFQVKLRGFRIELGEIEAVLAADPAVDQAVVALHGTGEEAALIAYCRGPDAGAEPRLRQALTDQLPGYMIPAAFVFLDAFPLNPNGKVDRKRLPVPSLRVAAAQGGAETATEGFLARLWGDVFATAPVGREADFFARGGHSLLAMRMIARLPHSGPRSLPLRLLFEHPRLADFAAALDRAGILAADVAATLPPMPRLPAGAERPLSFAQERQWMLAQLDPDSATYNIPAALRLSGPLDMQRLCRAFTLLCERHEVLRSAYPAEGGRARVILRPAGAEAVPVETVTEDRLGDRLAEASARPFDLAPGPLIRLQAYSLAPQDHVVLLVLHHIIGDAQSVQLVLHELVGLYAALAGNPAHRPPVLPVQYADFAAWQRGQDMGGQIGYWRAQLEDAPPLLDLPKDFPRPARQDFGGGSVDFTLDTDTSQRLRRLAEAAGATPYMALLTSFAALLGRYAGVGEAVIGTPITQRPHPDLDGLVGMFVNTLALRLPCDAKAGFDTLLQEVRDRVVEGMAHQDVPFDRLVDLLAAERSLSHNPLFQVMFVWKTRDAAPVPAGGLHWQPMVLPGTAAKVDLTLAVLDRGDGFDCRLEYRSDLFRHGTITHMARAFETLVNAIVETPARPVGQQSLMHPDQAAEIARWNANARPWPATPQTLHGLVTACAARAGDSIAIRDVEGAITYAALETRSDTLAAHLQARGIGRGDRVGIALPRRIDLICAILATLKAGAAYVPLDPRYPADRIAYIAQDAQLALLLTEGDGGDNPTLDMRQFWDGAPGRGDTRNGIAPRPRAVGSESGDLAYLIYTSGSTGKPKGVTLEHRNALAFVHWAAERFSDAQMAGVLGSTSVCFDLSVFEIFATLSCGGTLLLVDDLFALPDAPFAGQVTLINTVPTPMAELLRLGPLPASARTVCLAGEPLPPALADAIHGTGSVDTLWNLYGPSEDTTYSTGMIVPRTGGFNIGQPISNTCAYVLDAHGQPLPPGVPGELYLAGAGIARGYWQQPELTSERFLANPFDTDGRAPVMYRTGDRVRRAPDGSLDYMGRGDRQVKLRGFRIEPGEVETVLGHYPGVTAAAVDLWRDAGGNGRLTAWIERAEAVADRDLTAWLAERLPGYMVPTVFVARPELPRLPNGKLNRNALPLPEWQPQSTPGTPPRDGLETRLAMIWQGHLGRSGVAREDNFFALGGDSILAIQVVAQARQEGIALSPRDLFQFTSLAALAEAAEGRAPLGIARGTATGRQSLTPIQHWFLNRDLPQPQHWNQALVLQPTETLDLALLGRALATLADWHDGLRARFSRGAQGWEQTYLPPGDCPALQRATGDVTGAAAAMQRGFDLAEGPLWGALLCDTADGQRLAIAAHHLLVDGVSWRILLADLQAIYRALAAGAAPVQPPRATAPGDWAGVLAACPLFAGERDLWATQAVAPALPADHPQGRNTEADAISHETLIGENLTERLLQQVPAAYPVGAEEVMLTALLLAVRDWTGQSSLGVELESHGRADLTETVDLSRTVGWLTGLFPVVLAAAATASAGEALLAVKETLRRIPHDGIGHGVLRYLHGTALPAAQPGIRFNYLGQTGALFGAGSLFQPAPESAGPMIAPDNPRDTLIDINAISGNGRLRLRFHFSGAQFRPATIAALGDSFARHLETLVTHCLEGDDLGFTPSDFPEMDFDQGELDDLLQSI